MSQRRAVGYLLIAIAACSWGVWPLILRAAESIAHIPVALESALVMAVVTIVSAPFCLRDRIARRARPVEWAGVAFLGVADALNVVFFFAAYQTTSVAIAVLTHYLTPILVAVAAPLVLRETLRRRTIVAVAVSFAGLVLLLRPWSAERHAGDWLGAALGAGSALFYASNVLVNKRLTSAFSGSELVFFHGVVATPLLLAFARPSTWGLVDLRALGVVAAGAAVSGALAGLFFVWGLRRVPATHASNLTLLEPLVAVSSAAAFLGEPVGAWGIAGGALILAGAAVVVSSP